MINKRALKEKVVSNPFPIWREKPAGPEQQELERLFMEKKINPTATADSVRQSNENFKKFSASVFSNHFRKTKARLGLCGTTSNIFFLILRKKCVL
jgi:hypothetical protein